MINILGLTVKIQKDKYTCQSHFRVIFNCRLIRQNRIRLMLHTFKQDLSTGAYLQFLIDFMDMCPDRFNIDK